MNNEYKVIEENAEVAIIMSDAAAGAAELKWIDDAMGGAL